VHPCWRFPVCPPSLEDLPAGLRAARLGFPRRRNPDRPRCRGCAVAALRSFHREALEEFDEAAKSYAVINPALGQRCYHVIDGLITDACKSPGTFRFNRKPARRHFTRDFPYGIIYVERPDDIWILAVRHLHREPGTRARIPPCTLLVRVLLAMGPHKRLCKITLKE
jgi:toxin ParE1/3/4